MHGRWRCPCLPVRHSSVYATAELGPRKSDQRTLRPFLNSRRHTQERLGEEHARTTLPRVTFGAVHVGRGGRYRANMECWLASDLPTSPGSQLAGPISSGTVGPRRCVCCGVGERSARNTFRICQIAGRGADAERERETGRPRPCTEVEKSWMLPKQRRSYRSLIRSPGGAPHP